MSYRIAYLGPSGTFTEEALRKLCHHYLSFSKEQSIEMIPKVTIPDCLSSCQKDEVDFAMVPIENSIEGSVNMTLDWLIHQVDLPIRAELILPISQFAIIHPNHEHLELKEIETIFSHPHAIAQCHEFIRKHCPNSTIEYMKSTSDAVGWVAKHPEHKYLAIGTQLAAELNQCLIRAAEIEDYENNFTRFVLVGRKVMAEIKQEEAKHSGKTTILITLPEDYPGALHQVLSAFAWRKLNLSRIESRPTKKCLGSYFFFIDIEQIMDDVLLPGAISEIEALGCQVRYLGSYPCFLPKTMSKLPT
ncbi:prephenate dehydratase [Caldalkalibacillus mannanilyticus]|uniref:prephenate dehydratase n=1 Tax=Caldalkalibacillus mannanilyticus TaxID=1418 RepID=UPI000467FE56|nr:prephenate dehydratase [Caldalkalibacillus mannanilyticus]